MLEHYEVVELEKKWENYTKSKTKDGFLQKINEFAKQNMDKTVIILLCIIAVGAGAIVWLMGSKDGEVAQALEANSTIISSALEATPETTKKSAIVETNLTANQEIGESFSYPRASLQLNDIGISSSVDSGGFTINNTYNADSANSSQNPGVMSDSEFIDFGNAPNPPRTKIGSNTPRISKPNIQITSKNLSRANQTLEDKFNQTKDIAISLELSQQAYDRANYTEAIKWALVSNEIDKNNVKSWVLFAKSNYKLGRKNDAIVALRSLNQRLPNPEILELLNQMQTGAFQ
ncbi:MAG: CDC27 family protein [Campylobacter sp.]|nr:CDC27 family protein [Campylobacter sp.]